jgi:diguanylate cyclase (GGDEF)-like protein/PAS domain S-box-containing protein
MRQGVPIRASLAVLVLATALPFVALIVYNAYSQAQLEAEQAGAEALRAARASAAEVGATLHRTRELLGHLATQPAVRSLDARHCELAFRSFNALFPQYTNVVTVHSSGERVCSATQLPAGASSKIDPAIFLDETVRTRAFTIGEIRRGVFSGRWIMPIAYPLTDERGQVVGAVSVPMDLARLRLAPDAAELPPHALARIVNAKGTVVGSSLEPEKWIGQSLAGLPWFSQLQAGRPATVQSIDAFGQERIFGVAPIEGTNWHAMVGIPINVVYGPVRERLALNAAVALVALLLAAALGYLIARRIARPVEAIAAAAREAAHGAPGQLVQAKLALAPREIRGLAGDFSAMLEARVAAERELRESEAGLQRAQLMAQLAHVITGEDGAFESWSDTLPALLGIDAARMPRSTREWLERIHPDDRAAFRAVSIEAAAKHTRGFIEYRLRGPNGEWMHVRQVIEPLPGAEARWFSTLQNISTQKRAAEAIHRAQQNYRSIFENTVEGIYRVDKTGRVVAANPALARMLGYESHEDMLSNISNVATQVYVDPEARKRFRELLRERGTVSGFETRWRRKDGSVIWVSLSGRDVAESADGVGYHLGTAQDITEQKRAEQALQESEAGLKRLNRVYAVLSGINSLIVRVHDREQLFRDVCRLVVETGKFTAVWIGNVERHTGRIEPVAWHGVGDDYLRIMPLELEPSAPRYGLAGRAVNERQAVVVADMATDPRVTLRGEADQRGFHSLVMLPLVVAEEVVGVLALYAVEIGFFDADEMKLLLELAGDISFSLEHMAKAEKLEYLAYHDPLTGLANRALLMERLAQAAGTAGREQRKFALVISDIERFKIINDTLGRPAGDELLKQMTARLIELTGDPQRVARISSDHFAVLIPEGGDEAKVARIIEAGGAHVENQPFVLGGTEVRVAVRSGIAMFPSDGAEADVLFRNAEAALKNAKTSGERYLFYAREMGERVAGKLSLETKLRRALDNDEFVLHYQPKVDLESRKIVGLEALIRWQSAELGLVPPAKFVALLEETGLILPVGVWALRRAALDHRGWTERKLNPPRVAVNVSAVQLRQRDFVGVVQSAILDGVAPTGVDLEITESLIMEDIQRNIEKLNAVRGLGVNIAIDDFGTGYSSLSYLARLPVETLKIDRSFVITMLHDPNTAMLVQTIISLAHSLRLKVVAEGVESEEQAKVLQLLRCDEMQGYLFSKPLPLEQTGELLLRSR